MFDSAHRSQNQIIRRQIEKDNASADSDYSDLDIANSSGERLGTIISTTSSGTPLLSNRKTASRCIVHSGKFQGSGSTAVADEELTVCTYSIPRDVGRHPEDISICFFFRHYGGTTIDPETNGGFNQLWPQMYSRSPAQSSLRLATAAVTASIAALWSLPGYDALQAREVFGKAMSAARYALQDPRECSTDELLMTILVFDLYETLALHCSCERLEYGKHKDGALAIIEDRGLANTTKPQARALIGAVRHTLLPHVLAARKPFPNRLNYLFEHPSINNTKALNLDRISVQLSLIQSRIWYLRQSDRTEKSLEDRKAGYEEIVADALRVEKRLLNWKANITHSDWLPEYVPSYLVNESILNAGFYGVRCLVWTDLSFGSMWVLFSMRRLLALQIIRQAFADETSLSMRPEQQNLLANVIQEMQDLVDFICESVPFFLGDNTSSTNPTNGIPINFPHATRLDKRTDYRIHLPGLTSNHQKRAVVSGGWILFPHLVNVWRLTEPEDDAVPVMLRSGQLDWIKGQVKRLQKISLFSDPVWFKRTPCESGKERQNLGVEA